jgi:DNA-binding NarL/FixJ family response regulator
MIRILLVDDQKMIREALRVLLEPERDFQIVGTAGDGLSALEQVETLNPDVVIMNVEMPGLDGIIATQTITKNFTNTKILILSSYDTDEYVAKLLAVGAKGYLLKNAAPQDIAAAIRSVNKGYTQISPGLLEKLLVLTNSGTVVNKLVDRSDSQKSKSSGLDIPKLPTRNLLKSSQLNVRQNKIELDKIHQELPQIKKVVSSYSKHIWRIWILLLTLTPAICLILFSFYTRINNLEGRSVPIERIGLYGSLNLSGLAQRVVKAFEQDTQLANISNIYVAQKGSTIFLRGTIADSTLLGRMENVARDVEGVTQVDTSSIQIRESKNLLSFE